MVFSVEFDESLYFQGFDGILEGYFDDLLNSKSDKNVDFSRFYRTRYRTQNGGRGVGTSDMPFPVIEHLF